MSTTCVSINKVKYLIIQCGYTERLTKQQIDKKICDEKKIEVIYIDSVYDTMSDEERSYIIHYNTWGEDKMWGTIVFKFMETTNISGVLSVVDLLSYIKFCGCFDVSFIYKMDVTTSENGDQIIQIEIDCESG